MRQYGRYVVKRLLGKGAFGQVFLAHDPKTKRDVALKVPRRRMQPGSEEDERFLREARAVAALQHQHICPLFDFLETADRIVLVMPYIEGGTLAEKIKQCDFSLVKSLRLVETLASAMAYAHETGVVHRDLKPANILIDKNQSKPFITDFGLALRDQSDETKLTQDGQLLGTPAYMSPEQAEGDHERIGPASDIYALGIILYELCTGQLPFTGSVTAVLGQILTKEPAAPSSLNPDISSSLEQVILKAIAKNPEDRFSTMKNFASALNQFQSTNQSSTSLKTIRLDQNGIDFNKKWIATGITILVFAVGIGIFFPTNPETTDSTTTTSQNSPSKSTRTELVLLEQIDLLKKIQLPDDIVVGDWIKNSDGLLVNPMDFSRLAIPVQTESDYQLDLELTRVIGSGEINLIFPIGNRACMLSLGRDDWCGLALPYGREVGRVIPGHFPNGQRHKLSLKVSIENKLASIEAKLNGLSILNWEGTLETLNLRSDWQVQHKGFGLGTHRQQVVFHKLMLHVESEDTISHKRWRKRKTNEYRQWKDLLHEIDLSQFVFRGNWQIMISPSDHTNNKVDQRGLAIGRGEDFARLILPVVPTGSYQLQVNLKRIEGDGEINLLLPVGKAFCMFSLGKDGNQFGIQHINGQYLDIRQDGIFTNGKQHLLDVKVTLGEGEKATLHFAIDNQEILNWQGKQSDLSIREMWRIHPIALGLGVDQDFVQFQQVLFQNRTGTVFQLEDRVQD